MVFASAFYPYHQQAYLMTFRVPACSYIACHFCTLRSLFLARMYLPYTTLSRGCGALLPPQYNDVTI